MCVWDFIGFLWFRFVTILLQKYATSNGSLFQCPHDLIITSALPLSPRTLSVLILQYRNSCLLPLVSSFIKTSLMRRSTANSTVTIWSSNLHPNATCPFLVTLLGVRLDRIPDQICNGLPQSPISWSGTSPLISHICDLKLFVPSFGLNTQPL